MEALLLLGAIGVFALSMPLIQALGKFLLRNPPATRNSAWFD